MCGDARRESGSVLLLMPAGVLVVLILGALAVDAAVLFLGERELADLSAAAANDAATAALEEAAFYACGDLRLDEARARAVAANVVTARTSDAVRVEDLVVEVRNDRQPVDVTVHATGTVRLLFTPAVPGASRARVVAARSTASPRQDGAGNPGGRCGGS